MLESVFDVEMFLTATAVQVAIGKSEPASQDRPQYRRMHAADDCSSDTHPRGKPEGGARSAIDTRKSIRPFDLKFSFI